MSHAGASPCALGVGINQPFGNLRGLNNGVLRPQGDGEAREVLLRRMHEHRSGLEMAP